VTAAVSDSLIGLVLADKYRVLRPIGDGGMGIVYEAEHIGLAKRVAIKMMRDRYAHDKEAVARFHREALAASRIGNPHIVDVSDLGLTPAGHSFVVMELLSGFPLSQVIETTGPMPVPRALHIIRQVLRGVGAAHAKGIIHRDLKPDNIFLDPDGEPGDFVKLLDFGISKVVDLDEQVAMTKLTSTGVVMGTPAYMAPEQAMGQRTGRPCDLYACGVILYELLAGRPPFDGATYAMLAAQLLTSPPPDLGVIRPDLSARLVSAVHHALNKDPAHRFQSAEQFAAALSTESTEPNAHPPMQLGVAPIETVRVRGSRRSWPWLAALAALAVSATTVAVVLSRRGEVASPEAPSSPKLAAPPVAASETSPPKVAPASVPTTSPIVTPIVTPIPATGDLEVESIPRGGWVTVDGGPARRAPSTFSLPAGRHRVRVELAGYDGIEIDQEVRAQERKLVVMPLQKHVHSGKPVRPGNVKPGGKDPTPPAGPPKLALPPAEPPVNPPTKQNPDPNAPISDPFRPGGT